MVIVDIGWHSRSLLLKLSFHNTSQDQPILYLSEAVVQISPQSNISI